MHLLLLFYGAFLSDASPDLLNRVQKAYQNAGDITATFSQTYADALRGKRRVESGRLWIKKDGRVRWTYMVPQRKDFIYDGKSAYFYEPENAQVTVFEQFRDSPVASAMQLMWGHGDIRKTFAIEPCDPTCPPLASGEAAVLLVPQGGGMAAVDHVVLVMQETPPRVRRSLVFDPLGNRTEYAFNEVQFGSQIDTQKFSFTVPPGVSLLRTTAEGTALPH